MLQAVPLLSPPQIPANTQPPSTYADSLFFANQWQPAKTAYREYLLKYPEAALPKLRIAFCQSRQNRPDEAINGLQQLTNMADLPANLLPMVQCRLAMAYSLKKNNTQAFEWLQKAQSNGYNNVYELEQDIAFANIQKDSRLKSLREAMLLASYPCLRDTKSSPCIRFLGGGMGKCFLIALPGSAPVPVRSRMFPAAA